MTRTMQRLTALWMLLAGSIGQAGSTTCTMHREAMPSSVAEPAVDAVRHHGHASRATATAGGARAGAGAMDLPADAPRTGCGLAMACGSMVPATAMTASALPSLPTHSAASRVGTRASADLPPLTPPPRPFP